MKQGKPSITAPLSKKSNDNNSSFIGLVCAVVSAVVAFVGTLILCISVMSSSSTSTSNIQTKSSGSIRSVVEKNTQPNDIMIPLTQQPKGLIIHTHLGDIRILFTPELSGESSINYIKEVVQTASSKQNSGMVTIGETANGRRVTEGYKCSRCKFYRSEKQLLLQGVIAQVDVPKNTELGPCPLENFKPKNKCPDHDPNCGCHGPIMKKGMVGWAGGGGGPDFFINTFKNPVDWWENQHTVWGMLDDASIKLVESIYDLPVHGTGMKMLDEEIEISLELF